MDKDIDQKMADVSLKSSFQSRVDSNTTLNVEFSQRIRDILNKMTPDLFETILEEIKGLNFTADEDVQLKKIVRLIFEKAVLEPTSSCIYAQLCGKMSESFDSKFNGFKKIMISVCQQEFQNYVFVVDKIAAKKLQKVEEAMDPDEKADSQKNYENKHWKLQRRSVGIVRFIGELFKIEILTPRILTYCVQTLLDRNSESKLECLCELLTIIGSRLEDENNPANTRDLSRCFQTLKEIVDNMHQSVEISSRVKFMIEDVIDLRKSNWTTGRGVVNNDLDHESIRGGRNNLRRVSWIKTTSTKFRNIIDPSKFFKNVNDSTTLDKASLVSTDTFSTLDATRNSSSDNTSYSIEGDLKSRRGSNDNRCSNSAKPMTASSLSFQSDELQGTVQGDIDQEPEKYLFAMVRELYNSSVDTRQKSTHRIFAGEVVCTWINLKLVTVQDNLRALKEFLESVLDSVNSMIWTNIVELITPTIKKNHLSLKQIRSICPAEHVMEQILQHLIPYLTMEHGPQFVRNLFKECEWCDLISAKKVKKFVRKNKFEFVKDNKVIVRRIVTGPTNTDLIQKRVKEFLNDGADLNVIHEFIAVHLAEISREFIRALTTAVIEFLMNDKTFKFKEKPYVSAIVLLTSYIGDDVYLQRQGLNAIQLLMNKLEYPKNAIQLIFSRLYDDQVVFKDVFHMWRDSEEILDGKDEALSKVQAFFEFIGEESSDESF